MEIKEKLKTLPHSPGVYVMKDSDNSVLYVGKSKNLKNRVSSYFHSSKAHSPKIVKLVKHLKDFDYVLTDTEFEAFMLECRLIKELKPLYNRLMKNPMSYNFIEISKDYLNIEICSEKTDTLNNYYFGPFSSKGTIENALAGIKEICRIKCGSNFKSNSPCLNYSLGTCIGICFDATAKAEYPSIVEKIAKLLDGTSTELIEKMENKMKLSAEVLDFQAAAKYRDYISAVGSVINKGKVIEFAKEHENIVVAEYLDHRNLKVFLTSGSDIIFKDKYCLEEKDPSELVREISSKVICLLKQKSLQSSMDVGKNEIDELQIIYSYFKSSKNSCRHIIVPDSWVLNEDKVSLEAALLSLL